MTFRAKIWAVALLFCLAFWWAVGSAAFAASCGLASWYGSESGNKTANGEFFDGTSLTVAHRTLPFGTKVRISFEKKSVTVRVNDRGPFVRGREFDLSRAAAERIGLRAKGVARVCWEIIK
jgi:rare lipoprotein A